jgi:coenzyme Q-binding protein COQ10
LKNIQSSYLFVLDSHVYEKNKEGSQTLIIADLTIGKGPFKDTYKSDVKFDKKIAL